MCFYVTRKYITDCKKEAISLLFANPREYFGEYIRKHIIDIKEYIPMK